MAESEALSQYQKFEKRIISRSAISFMPGNVIAIDEDARERLRDMVAAWGLVEHIVWNEVTGHVISGHQRLGIVDEIQGSRDYSLEVAVVHLDEKTELAQAVFMNNPNTMGTYDIEKLQPLLADVDLKTAGFTVEELAVMVPGFQPPPDIATAPTPELDTSVVLVFRNREQNDRFMRMLHLSDFDKYISGEILAELVEKALTKDVAASS